MTTTIQDKLYEVVNKSSKGCDTFNTTNAALIDAGLQLPQRPNDKILEAERESARKAKLEAESKEAFNAACRLFWDKVIALLPEDMKKLTRATFFSSQSILGYDGPYRETRGEVEVYRQNSWDYYGRGKLRVVIGDYGRKTLLLSKTQDISKLSTETELITKVVKALTERFEREKHREEAKIVADNLRAQGDKAYKENEAVFNSLGIFSPYNVKANQYGAYNCSISFTGDIEQWKKLAEFISKL